jgi:hypothetical protein
MHARFVIHSSFLLPIYSKDIDDFSGI